MDKNDCDGSTGKVGMISIQCSRRREYVERPADPRNNGARDHTDVFVRDSVAYDILLKFSAGPRCRWHPVRKPPKRAPRWALTKGAPWVAALPAPFLRNMA